MKNVSFTWIELIHMPVQDIIQLTDTHIFASQGETFDGVDTAVSLQMVIDYIVLHEHPDLVIVTGDLVHFPSEEAYQRLSVILDPLVCPVICLPGNHDDPAMMLQFFVDQKIKVISRWCQGSWGILLLNSHLPAEHGGFLNKDELDRLKLTLEEQGDRPTLIALHHQPVPIQSPWMDAMALTNPDELWDVLDRFSNIKGLIWGHTHQQFKQQRNGTWLLGTPSTCVQFKPHSMQFEADSLSPAYRCLKLYEDGLIQTMVTYLPDDLMP